MHRELVHLYGPFAINSFGICIVLGLLVFTLFFLSDSKRPKIISTDDYFNLLAVAIISALVGGRLLFVLAHVRSFEPFWDVFAFWQGGFSLLGSVIALVVIMPLFFKKRSINALALLDLAAIYAPLLQAVSRIGCFMAGCCYGKPTGGPLGIFFPHSHALLHPTQLYSALALCIIFLSMYYVLSRHFKKPGQLVCIYLLLLSAERFIIDLWRGDREFFVTSWLQIFSIPQIIALALAALATCGFYYFTFIRKSRS